MSETVVVVEHLPVNPCCLLWQQQVSKLKEELSVSKAKLNQSTKARKALRKAIRILEPQNLMLKKECEGEKKRAEVREKEISVLRSEIFALKQKVGLGSEGLREKAGILQASESEGEKHIYKGREAWNIGEDDLAMPGKLQTENRELKMKDSAILVSAEEEISSLKSQITSLQQQLVPGAQDLHKDLVAQDADEEVTLLQEPVFKRETEISRLTELLEKFKHKADCADKDSEEERKKANDICPAEYVLAGDKIEIKIKESSVRVPLENEMPSLETQVPLLKQRAVSGAQDSSRAEDAEKEIIQRDREINRLKESLLKENTRPYSEMTKSYGERKTDDAENCRAGKLYTDKKAEEKQKELSLGHGFKAEVSALKSQIEFPQKGNGVRIETKVPRLFQAQVSEEQTELNQLKKLLENERNRADTEATKAKEGMQKASEAQKMVKTEKSRADEERRHAAKEKKRAEETSLQLGRLRAEVEVLRSNLVSETLKFEETSKKLETEKQKVIEEKQRRYNETTKAEENSRVLEMTKRRLVEEKFLADCLSLQMKDDRHGLGKLQEGIAEHASFTKNVMGDDSVKKTGFRTGIFNSLPQLEVIHRESGVSKLIMDCIQCRGLTKKLKEVKLKAKREKTLVDTEMAKAEELRKIVRTYCGNGIQNKRQFEELAHELEDNRCKTDELKKAIHELMSSGVLSNPLVNNSRNTDRRVKLLKKELKIGKMEVKHAKEVVSFEKGRNLLLQQEIWRIKKECSRISDHFDSLEKCFLRDVGLDDLKKKCNISRGRGLNLKRKFLEEEPCQNSDA
ncbi:uncharacterized protein LOC141697208 [Apium graveolens]|uniref:uncharacterized protein LOC141697208 n=1 Tax=Apium graveolens TaxID=4045 RepID=UPI003D797EF1